YSRFCLWNFITGSRDDGLHFEDAADYPSIAIEKSHASFPITNQTPNSSHRPDAMASNFVRFYLPSGEGTFTIAFNGDNSNPWRVRILKYTDSPTDTYFEDELTVDGNGDGNYVVNDPEDWEQVIMIPVNVSQTLNDRNYTYSAYWEPWTGYDVDINWIRDDSVYSATWTTARFQVVNTGVQPDDFDLAASDLLGWNLGTVPSSVHLEAGETDTVGVNAYCAPGTTGGVLNWVTLSATATSAIGVADQDSCQVKVFLQRGDADNDGSINITDAVYIIAYIFSSGPAPLPVDLAGDADCDDITNIADAVAIIDYIFSGGEYPPCNPF
ncbi:MAG: dockerin type I repeat-containing protein, partial [bacterium]